MTEFNFNQTIEYIDGTRDLNFEAAQKWAREHGTSFEEDVAARKTVGGKLMRYFVIGDKPKPYVPTEDELKVQVRTVRNQYLEQTDKVMLADYPITDDERELYKQYRTYLRDYTLEDEWWLANPKTFEEWSVKMDSVQDELPHIVEEQTIETEEAE